MGEGRARHKLPEIINQQKYVGLSTAIKACHSHYCDNDSGAEAPLQIKTLEKKKKKTVFFQKRVDVEASR